jgi:hypothetical protein
MLYPNLYYYYFVTLFVTFIFSIYILPICSISFLSFSNYNFSGDAIVDDEFDLFNLRIFYLGELILSVKGKS